MADKVFVSPGVFTSERDLTFVTRQVGVTTLGVVGETTQGPAFQPIFVSNYDEFTSFFGGQNATKIKDTGAPKYELPYIAKSYLSQANQLFVTRILGFSGYDAGLSWGIALDGALDPGTVVETASALPFNINYTVTTGNTLVVQSDNVRIQELWDGGLLDEELSFLAQAGTGDTANISTVYQKVGSDFQGSEFNLEVVTVGSGLSGSTTGSTTGLTSEFSAESYADVENKVVALLRSRGTYDANENLNFEVTGQTGVDFGTTVIDAASDAKGNFTLNGTSTKSGPFNYSLSLDGTKKNYITKVLGKSTQDGTTAIFVEEIFENMFEDLVTSNKVRGIKIDGTIKYNRVFDDYKQQYQPAVTPWVVSELRGTSLLRLFRLWTISDGNTANEQFKISIKNINLNTREFDIEVRSYADTDARPAVLEVFTRCTMDPTSNNYIAKKVGTLDGDFASKSNFILVELNEESNTSDAFPAGFLGFPIRDYQDNSNTSVNSPTIEYNKTYGTFQNKRKFYLGLSNTVGIDKDFFTFKGAANDPVADINYTKGFHMDIDASGATVDNNGVNTTTFGFEVGDDEFRNEADVQNGPYEKIFARKFTFAPYGGFDGWDTYRTRRTNLDSYVVNGAKGIAGASGSNPAFKNIALSNGDIGINSDYYAYLEGIWTFNNPDAVNINVLTTPGIDSFDNTNLVEETIEMVEQNRADSIYIVTTPDTANGEILTPEDVVNNLDGQFDSSYTATYWPWVQVNDSENNVFIYMPPTRDVVRNIALTDNISFPWFSVAGVQRGDVSAIKARRKLTQTDRDVLYDGRINPITTFATEGIKIWGNKTLQVKDTALNRINVRRLLLQARKLISAVSIRLLFEQNDDIVRNQFLSLVNPILDNIRAERGLTDFRVVLDSSPESIDRNELCGKIYLKPTRALEFICVEFNILNTGASFDDI